MSLLPPNANSLELSLEAVTTESNVPTPLQALWSADDCPVSLLPWLAWSLGVRSWDPTWSEAIKRNQIRQAIPQARQLGTVQSVKNIVHAFGQNVAMREWFQTDPVGEPHTFSVVVSASGQGAPEDEAAFIEALGKEIERVKPLRSHFTLSQGLSSISSLGVIAATRAALSGRMNAAAPDASGDMIYPTYFVADDGAYFALDGGELLVTEAT
ncbi:MAG: phage tail protein I [Asticcacaulis sp.]|uniref:phage tail protein I n=1 Tax=Asticcacaulis sp. TaxID=1872648 RepID=UPI003F7B9547